MKSQEVTVSGGVGKQVFGATTDSVVLRGIMLTLSGANGSVVIRDGNASGEVKYTIRGLSGSTPTTPVELPGRGARFDKGMHVKVLGSGALAYLFVE